MEVQQSLISSNDGSMPLKDPFGMFDYSKPNFDKCFDVLSELRVTPQSESQLDDQLPDILAPSTITNVSLDQDECRPEKLQEASTAQELVKEEEEEEEEEAGVKTRRQGSAEREDKKTTTTCLSPSLLFSEEQTCFTGRSKFSALRHPTIATILVPVNGA
ncbi:hypothetical protein TCAL_15721 [Tigriopus californicus]|uniref:Uncharacterized protein n=1 Tax=Tigriopus californicus TaxID=6832 RepID=A0A553P8M7_TIGCA|nr:hypothetical protein TCAL_15721 [Tigriopus californicus]